MLNALMQLARPALLALDPETAHETTLRALEMGVYPADRSTDPSTLASRLGDLALPNPIAIAAGFDKDARVPDAILGLGCGFAEIGTVTPLPQSGNPRPRIFRLINERAAINRLGFNNGGHQAALVRLKARLDRRGAHGVVGVNIGANKDATDRTGDYVTGINVFYDVASYFTVNISSPNTPGLRDLQAPAALDELLGRVMEAREKQITAGKPRRPIVVKIAPDVAEADLPAITERLIAHNVDAIAVSNTTLSRPGVGGNATSKEMGGLSGRPLFHRSTAMLARVYVATGGKVPLIGIGGIDSPEAAITKIKAGATLLQLYTGLIYEGSSLIGRIKSHLDKACNAHNVANISQLTGQRAAEWASKSLDG